MSGAAEAESATAFFTPRELESYELPDLPDRTEARNFFGDTGRSFQALFSIENLPTLSVVLRRSFCRRARLDE